MPTNLLTLTVSYSGAGKIDVTADINAEDDATGDELQRIHDALIDALKRILGEPTSTETVASSS